MKAFIDFTKGTVIVIGDDKQNSSLKLSDIASAQVFEAEINPLHEAGLKQQAAIIKERAAAAKKIAKRKAPVKKK